MVVDIFWLVVGGGVTYPVCCEEIKSDRTSFDFSDRAFDNIFRSTLNKETGLQFFMNLLSSTFFS